MYQTTTESTMITTINCTTNDASDKQSSSSSSSSSSSNCNQPLNQQTETNKATIKKQVSFGPVVKSPETYTLTSTAKKRMWYNEREIENMQQRAMWIAEKRIPLDATKDSLRGLELYLKTECYDTREMAKQNMQIILEQHQHQQHETRFNQSLSLNGSSTHSASSSYASSGFGDESFSSMISTASCGSLISEELARISSERAAQDSQEALQVYLEAFEKDLVESLFKQTAQ